MAKGVEINEQLRGKRGAIVYYRAFGQQISRAKASQVSNPRTPAQMRQRLMLGNVAKITSGLRAIVDHSFEGVAYGGASLRYFASKAQAALKVLTPSTKGAFNVTPCVPLDGVGFPVAGYEISRGTLPRTQFALTQRATDGAITAVQATGVSSITGEVGDITVADFYAAFGAQVGDQLTFVLIRPQESVGGASSEEVMYDNYMSAIVRLNIIADADPAANIFMSDGKFSEVVVDASRSQNLDMLTAQVAVGNLTLSFAAEPLSAVAVIASRYKDGVWRRSSETLRTAAMSGSSTASSDLLPAWGWNDYDAILATIAKTKTIVEDRLLNKELTAGFTEGV